MNVEVNKAQKFIEHHTDNFCIVGDLGTSAKIYLKLMFLFIMKVIFFI